MDDYIKSLEEQNEELKQKLAECQSFRPEWFADGRVPPMPLPISRFEWHYLIMGKSTVLAAIHHVKNVKIEGYKICILKTPIGWSSSCNVECQFDESATTSTFEEAKKYVEDRLLNG